MLLEKFSNQSILPILEYQTGIIIPVYFAQDMDPAVGIELLSNTIIMFVREISDPAMICLSVDGPGPARQIAQQVASDFNVQYTTTAVNRGKLSAVRHGVAHLAKTHTYHYVAIVDQDGDHFGNELLNFVRAAEHVVQTAQTEDVWVLGNRLSRHRPLGFLRGEQETLANQMLMDALAYDAVQTNQPLNWQFLDVAEALPDFHSGYKLFSRATAEAIFLSSPQLAGCTEDAYYRHGCEAVMSVEALKQGAVLTTVQRRTFDEQPISIFAKMDRSQLAANMIIWPCKRLNIPAHFVEQWLTNHIYRLLLGTLTPQGSHELLAIQQLVLESFGLSVTAAEAKVLARPRFV